MKIAIQGIAGSFHHEAATRYFSDTPITLVECLDFVSVFDAVQNGSAEYGVVAVENSLQGPINQVYRLLAEQRLWVVGEMRLQIALCLIGCQPATVAVCNTAQTVVQSHFAALAQCERWLRDYLDHANIQECPDTALAVREVMEGQDPQQLAIASEHAAELYGATVLARHITDDPENYTRFFIISREQEITPAANRTSIILHENTSDRPGILYEALGIFKQAGVNLSKLDSHPKPGRQRSYTFYIDLETGLTSTASRAIIAQLKRAGWDVQVLGSYLAHDEPTEV